MRQRACHPTASPTEHASCSLISLPSTSWEWYPCSFNLHFSVSEVKFLFMFQDLVYLFMKYRSVYFSIGFGVVFSFLVCKSPSHVRSITYHLWDMLEILYSPASCPWPCLQLPCGKAAHCLHFRRVKLIRLLFFKLMSSGFWVTENLPPHPGHTHSSVWLVVPAWFQFLYLEPWSVCLFLCML